MKKTYTIYEPPGDDRPLLERAENFLFVKDGFSWLAFLIPFIWLLVHWMWRVLIAYIVGVILLSGIMRGLDFSPPLQSLVMVFAHFAFGLHANDLRRWELEKKEYQLLDVVHGRSLLACEARFFRGWDGETRPFSELPDTDISDSDLGKHVSTTPASVLP